MGTTLHARYVKTASAALAALALAFGATGPSMASESGSGDQFEPMHNITCHWRGTIPPWGVTGTAVGGYVQVGCSDKLDKANTEAAIQRYSGGQWRDHGTPVISHSTGSYSSSDGEYVIHVYDSAGKQSGGWYYRMRGHHFGQHGNIFALDPYYSGSRHLTKTS